MISFILRLFFGTKAERDIKKLKPVVELINSIEEEVKSYSDEQLAEKTNQFKEQLRDGKTLDDVLPEAFAVVRETARRVLGKLSECGMIEFDRSTYPGFCRLK